MVTSVRAWRPTVPGVREVLHASFPHHAYPMHTHDTWTLLLVDIGTVRYDLDRHEHEADGARVTLLPPHVPHDGAGVADRGFRKRVVYLDADTLGADRIGRAVDRPDWFDTDLWREVHALHDALAGPVDDLEAESRLAVVTERLAAHLDRRQLARAVAEPALVRRLRDLLDEHVVEGVSLAEASELLGRDPSHLVRVFRRTTGISPHRYLTGRRLDRARRLLLAGHRPADVAVEVGFHDQAHLTRHFKRLLGVTPARYAEPTRSRRPQ